MEAGGKNKNQKFHFVETGIVIPVSSCCQRQFFHITDSEITSGLLMLSGYFIATSEALIRYQN